MRVVRTRRIMLRTARDGLPDLAHSHSAIRPPSLCLTIRTSGLLSGALEHATSTTRRPLSAACCLRLWQSRRFAYRLVCSWHPIRGRRVYYKRRPATRLDIKISGRNRKIISGWGNFCIWHLIEDREGIPKAGRPATRLEEQILKMILLHTTI